MFIIILLLFPIDSCTKYIDATVCEVRVCTPVFYKDEKYIIFLRKTEVTVFS